MKISIESSVMFMTFAQLLKKLVDQAAIYTRGIEYSKDGNVEIERELETAQELMGEIEEIVVRYEDGEGVVKVPMKRLEKIEKERKGCLLCVAPSYWVYGKEWIDAVLTVRKVSELNVVVDKTFLIRHRSYFPVMMGLEVWGNELYISSPDYGGTMGAYVDVKVKEFNIEFEDRADLGLP